MSGSALAKKNGSQVEDGAIVLSPSVVSAISEVTGWNRRQVETLKQQIAKNISDDELLLFSHVCSNTKLNPFKRQIYAIARWDNKENRNVMSIQTGIDGFRTIASRTGVYAGSDRVLFDEGFTSYENIKQGKKQPDYAVCRVWKIVQGQKVAFDGEALWEEFYPGDKQGFMWRSKPYLMLGKCFSSDTEVLTTNGFERFDSVTGQILQVTGAGLSVTDSKPFYQYYSGEMIQSDGDMLNFSVTPNHDMVTTFGKVEAGAMYATTRTRPVWRIPLCIDSSTIDSPIRDEDLELAGYVLADGHHSGYKQWRVSVSRQDKIEKLRSLNPQSEGIQHSRGNVAVTQSREIKSNFDKVVFAFETERIESLVNSDKTLNIKTLMTLSMRQARILLDAWQMFDGHTRANGSRFIYTSREDHVKALEVLAVIAGYSVSVPKARMSDISAKTGYSLTISSPDPQPVVLPHADRPGIYKTQNIDDKVWCVTVPSGVIIVRRDGFSMVCGNCAEAQALRKAFPDELGELDFAATEPSVAEPNQIYSKVDYTESDQWQKVVGVFDRATDADKIDKATTWAHQLVNDGKLPKVARNGIDRLEQTAKDKLNDLTAGTGVDTAIDASFTESPVAAEEDF